MRKIFYAILCFIANAKEMHYLREVNMPLSDEMIERFGRCEMVGLSEAFHLMSVSFEPAHVYYGSRGDFDKFFFHRSAALMMSLHDYSKKINKVVDAVTWDQLEPLYEIPTSKFTPAEGDDAHFTYAPFGYARERFVYESWPAEMREKYISSNADSRMEMIAAAYSRG